MQAVLGSCHTNIEQPAFFLEIRVHICLFVRNDAFIDIDKEHLLKLQPFGAVKGGEDDRIRIMFFFAALLF